jgi:hypothetical protein
VVNPDGSTSVAAHAAPLSSGCRSYSATSTQLTHQILDQLPAGKPVEHLRSVLVAIGTLPPGDEQMARLERWLT